MRTWVFIACALAPCLLQGACHSNDVATTGSEPGDAAADPWACLDQPPQVTSSSPVAITFKTFDALDPITTAGPTGGSDFTVVSFVPLPGIAIEGCTFSDTSCSMPATPVGTSDDAGEATLTVPDNFNGFFSLTRTNYLPLAHYPGPLLADASSFAPAVSMIEPQAAISLAEALGATAELDAGASVAAVFVEMYDCFDRYAAGVSLAMSATDSTTVPFYIASGLPSRTATQTDSSGTGGAVNVPVGPLTVTATLAATNRALGSVEVVIRPGGATSAWIRARTHS